MAAAVETSARPLLKDHDNVATIQYLLQKGTITQLPQSFVWSEKMKHNMSTTNVRAQESADVCSGKLSLPVIDISALRDAAKDPASVQKVEREIGDASRNWGFFQVVNHGVPEELMKEVLLQGMQFFSLPVEMKEKAVFENGTVSQLGYNGRMKGNNFETNTPWTETLSARGTEVEPLARGVWPEGNPSMSKPMEEYWRMVDKVGHVIIEALSHHLGVEPSILKTMLKDPDHDAAESLDLPRYNSAWRLCNYPSCPLADQTIGLGPHADPNLLTLLQQDEVGGLQVRKGENWIDVAPMPGALCINVGDSLQAWSNNSFSSVEHRVRVSEKSNRVSAAYFMAARRDQVIEAPPQLIDDEHPQLYRPFSYGEYLTSIFKKRLIGKSALDFARKPASAA
ncbi:hypothetical protein Mapa_015146 [Marchantia paleacea]|nr:hypothetical protein Mapa_015146 [Marchantia paleacea]